MALKKFNAVSGFSVGDTVIRDVIDNAANVSANNLSVSAQANLGSISNVKITGGTAGQVIKTDGTGNLVWGQDSASAAGSDSQIQFNTANSLDASSNFTFDSVTNTLHVDGYIARDNKNVPTYVTSATAPLDPKPGDTWYNSSNDTIYQYIYDGATFLWIDSSSGYISATVEATPDMIALRDGNGNVYANSLTANTVNGNTLNVSGKSYLGPVGNLHISGGVSGQVLTTDGTGNLLWTAISTDTASFSNGSSYLTINYDSNIDMTIDGVVNVLTVGNTGITVNGNANLGNVATANFFSGNGSSLFGISGSNVTGYVANATHANIADSANSVAGPNVSGTVANAVFALSAGAVAGANVSGTVANATFATTAGAVAGANVTGTVANATFALSAGAVDGANVTGIVANAVFADSVASVDAANVIGTVANATFATTAGAVAGANVTGYVPNANHANIADAANSVAGANVTGTVSSATVAASANSVAGANVTGYVSLANKSNIADVANSVAGANVTGYVSLANKSNIADVANLVAGANVTGIVANASYASNSNSANTAITVTASSQPNITSVGSLVGLTVNGNTTITGNLTITGTTITANTTTVNVKDPLIEMGGHPNGSPLVTDDGKDRGTILHYFTTSPVDAFMGWDNSNLEFALGSNVSVTNEVVTFNSYGNLRAHTIYANIIGLATTTLSVVSASQPNITTVGNLTSLTVVGNISGANVNGGNLVSANYLSGNGSLITAITGANVTGYVPNANHANIADVANLVAGANVTGTVASATNADHANISDVANSVAGANVTGYVSNADHANIADVANLVAGANVTGTVANATHSIYSDSANAVAGANVLGTVSSASYATTAGSVISISGANVTGYVGNALYADYAGGAYSVDGANVVGEVANAVYANTANIANSSNVANIANVANVADIANVANVAYSVSGSNITGQVANALIASTVYTNAQPNITSVGTLSSLSVSGNATIGNISTGNIATDNIYTDSIKYANGDPYVFSVGAAGITSQIQFNQSGVFAGSANLTYDSGSHTLTTDFINASGTQLRDLPGANVLGQVANSLVSGTVYTNAQPNITSLGTLTSLTASGPVNLGSITSLKISGGLPGYAITTDGAGNLSWSAAATGGGGSGGGAGFVSIVLDQFTGTGSQANFTLSTTPTNLQAIVVNIDGLVQLSSSYSLSGAVLSFASAPLLGEHIEVTTYGVVSVAGNSGEVQFNSGGDFSSSNAFTFNTTTNSLSVTGNLIASGGYLTLGSGMIAVSSGSAGIFTSGVSNINLGLVSNVTMGSSSGTVTARGNFVANTITSNTSVSTATLEVDEIRSGRTPVSVTGTTVIDSFAVNKYRTAKYTIRVGSDDGYQSIETLLIHNGTSSYITVYGSISTSGTDIVLITSGINGSNVELYATTASANTTVNLVGTYVAD